MHDYRVEIRHCAPPLPECLGFRGLGAPGSYRDTNELYEASKSARNKCMLYIYIYI